jgi:hypothetical protein
MMSQISCMIEWFTPTQSSEVYAPLVPHALFMVIKPKGLALASLMLLELLDKISPVWQHTWLSHLPMEWLQTSAAWRIPRKRMQAVQSVPRRAGSRTTR